MKIVVCAGGTGGHMFPACVLYRNLNLSGHEAYMVTDTRGDTFCGDIQNKIVLDTVRLSCLNIPSVIFSLMRTFFKLVRMWKRRKRPDAVISFGGILTFVPVIVAKMLGMKVIVYEQNAVVGKANRLLARIADLKLSTFDIGNGWVQVFAPVREEFRTPVPYVCDGKIKILIIGGSQGAASFSNIIPQMLSRLTEDERASIEIVQQVSYGDIDVLSYTYKQLHVKHELMKFVDNVAEVMKNTQLVICRAGASTLSELSALGLPAMLIPFPNAADNHQFVNAMYYQKQGAAWVFEERQGIVQLMTGRIRTLLKNRELLKKAASNMISSSVGQDKKTLIQLIERVCERN